MKKILWIDDEIYTLKSLIVLLERLNYSVLKANSGIEGYEVVKKEKVDLVLLDEIMPGMDGITVLKKIKKEFPTLPVIMITKSEDEEIINTAYAYGADDYLVKPLNPKQLLSTCKRILEKEKLVKGVIPEDYTLFSQQIRSKIVEEQNLLEWCSIYRSLIEWEGKLDKVKELKELHQNLIKECESEFAKLVIENYLDWIYSVNEEIVFSPELIEKIVLPYVESYRKVYLFILDCLSLRQWLGIKPAIESIAKVEERFYCSILPSATPFSRNAIYSGLYPYDISRLYPRFWGIEENKYEEELFQLLLKKLKIPGGYIKIRNLGEELTLRKNLTHLKDKKIISIVINFLDYLVHAKKESQVIEELIPDISSLSSLTRLWFLRSYIYEEIKKIVNDGDLIIITTDHGCILAEKPSVIYGSRTISTHLRYKYGPSLRCNLHHALVIEKPSEYKLPHQMKYAIAKEDYYFIYPTHIQEYTKEFKSTFQHGGISMQEMILPCAIVIPP